MVTWPVPAYINRLDAYLKRDAEPGFGKGFISVSNVFGDSRCGPAEVWQPRKSSLRHRPDFALRD